jgi:hypothetical protein
MGLHEIKKLLHNKRNVSKLKQPHTEWNKIFASYTSDKGLKTRIYRIYRKLKKLKKTSQGRGCGQGTGEEMTQTMYTHVNK